MTPLERESIAVILAIVINLPFGAYRATVRRFSWRWFVCVHLPIPVVIVMRLSLGLGWWFIPFTLASAVAGQLLGSLLFGLWRTRRAAIRHEVIE
jgi:hypothetical protein